MPRSGLRTTEHAIVWSLIVLTIFLLLRGHAADEIVKLLWGPSFAGGLYALGRGIAKGSGSAPFDLARIVRRASTGTTNRSRLTGAPPAEANRPAN